MPKRSSRPGKAAAGVADAVGPQRNGRATTIQLFFTAAFSFVLGHIAHSWSYSMTLAMVDTSGWSSLLDEDSWKVKPSKASNKFLPLFDNGPLNDRSMDMSPYVDHVWLDQDSTTSATQKLKVVLTDYGWNHPNQTAGMRFPRTLRSRELLQGIVNHPHFDPTFQWSIASKTAPDSNLQYVVFFDVETCFESNYPMYHEGALVNLDTSHHRQLYQHPTQNPRSCYQFHRNNPPTTQHCPYIDQILQSPFFQQSNNNARLVVFDCSGQGIDPTYRTTRQTSAKLSLVALSASSEQLLRPYDLGLPPPAVNPIRLSKSQRHKIAQCDGEEDDQVLGTPAHRFGYYLTCIASVQKVTPARRQLYDAFHNPDAGIILMQPIPFRNQFPHLRFDQVVQESIFSATPPGDNLFSYRFTEVMSSGAIPVLVGADNWVLPFSPLLLDWKDCLVTIPEHQVQETMNVLKAITPAKRCQMRRKCQEIYHKYMAHPEGTIVGIVQVMQQMMNSPIQPQ